MKKNRGFTLIELVVVITLLGILSAIALPRFINAQRDARIAKAQGVYGAIRSASVLGKTRCELDVGQGLTAAGTCGNAAPQVDMDGTVVDIVNRYPAASASGIQAAASLDPGNDGLTITAGNPMSIDIAGGAAGTCTISYTAATPTAAPIIVLTTSGC